MKWNFFIIDKDFKLFKCHLKGKKKIQVTPEDRFAYGEFPSQIFYINAYGWFFVQNELNNCPWYRKAFKHHLITIKKPMIIKLEPPQRESIDYRWGQMCTQTIWEAIELDYIMSWLSTLGGAFSALGDYDALPASKAATISFHQLKLAFRIGDPLTIAQCYLYLSIALIQQHKFRAAKQLIKQQYYFALERKEKNRFLINMCLGIWSKLRYTKQLVKNGQTLKDCVKVPPPSVEYRNGRVVETRLG